MTQVQPAGPSLQKQLPHKEARFEVVMYGSVSLAIYIHGVVQELLSLVRPTARNKDGTSLHPVQVDSGQNSVGSGLPLSAC